MRSVFCVVFFVFISASVLAQSNKLKDRKYPSLLWEISGNGLKKPSYLFGTMHVSSKMAFNLSDSFYLAIRKADVVALETNPESWQEDMFQYSFENEFADRIENGESGYRHEPKDYLSINTLKFSRYEKLIEAALASNPSAINNLLYRTYSEQQNDFEEDTYLDLYIYQAGKKWGKKVVGVERYAESMKLAMEAYIDALKDKKRKDRNIDFDDDFSYSKLQEAYRTGNLDLLDTINRVNSLSPLFDEKFLFRRNDIQAASIDSILKSGTSLFAGVGAAHLPGHRGVIEVLRRNGYKLRPVKMGERNSAHKETLEKTDVPVVFGTQHSGDGFYKVDVPGKLYRFSNALNGFDQVQYADMANGSYYVITRVQTNALSWGHTAIDVLKKVDSLLYENIPGRILLKLPITKNGYKGFAITNRTRRGDYQRYQVFTTPFEIIVFKISGNGEYLKDNPVADKFFNSIELKDYALQWKKFSPKFGGFEVEMPHLPYIIKNTNWQFLASDKISNIDFQIIRTDIHNYNFVEEDSFDLGLLEESFTRSDFYEKSISRKQTTYKGYPALDAVYRFKDGSTAMVRYLIHGPHYYTLVAHAKTEQPLMTKFLNSFAITPFLYKEAQLHADTSLHFTVTTPYYPVQKNTIEMPAGIETIYAGAMETDDEPAIERTVYRDKIIANDTTGERIYISFYKTPRYHYTRDSVNLKKQNRFLTDETSWVIKTINEVNKDERKIWEYKLTDTNSSRVVWTKTFYQKGITFTIRTLTDSLTKPSAFTAQFFQSFQPADTLKGIDPLTKKTTAFFEDLFSADTSTRKRALKNVLMVRFDAEDLPQLKKAIQVVNWKDNNYINTKKDLISKLSTIADQKASAYLKDLYYAAGDTVEFQYTALQALLGQQTKYSFSTFRDIMISEPPVLNISSGEENEYSETSFLNALYDSLSLTATIIKDLLPLINIDDYKYPVLEVMATLADSNLLARKDYEGYLSKFLLEAKQAWKKQVIAEKNKSIKRAQQKIELSHEQENGEDYGNAELSLYATLLMPFWDKNKAVPLLLQQMLTSGDQQLKYETGLLFLRNNKPVDDSLFRYFASSDEYRYPLYTDLKRANKMQFFPAANKTRIELAKSKLVNEARYDKLDSIIFLDTTSVEWKSRSGAIYFFKYKRSKEDNSWKIASVGLVPHSGEQFECDNTNDLYDYDFTGLSEVKLGEGEFVTEQLEKCKKQLLYSKRNSAKKFFQNADIDITTVQTFIK